MNWTPALMVSAVVPSILLVWYFRAVDVNPEPPRALWWTFLLGAAAAGPVVLFCLPIRPYIEAITDPAVRGWAEALILAAIPEELFKLAVIRRYAARHPAFDEPMDGIVYGAIAGLGFATLENILYVSSGGLVAAIARALTAVPNHAALGAIMGRYVARGRFGEEPAGSALAKAYLIPVALHALYDGPLIAGSHGWRPTSSLGALAPLLVVGAFFFEIAWVRRMVRALRTAQLALLRQVETVAVAAQGGSVVAVEQSLVEMDARGGSTKYARPVAILRLLLGGVLASLGGLVALVVAGALLSGTVPPGDRNLLLSGGLFLAAPTLLGGVLLFRSGLRTRPAGRSLPHLT